MGNTSKIELLGKEHFKNIIDRSPSFASVSNAYNLVSENGFINRVRKFAALWDVDISHIENKHHLPEHKCEREGCDNLTKNPRFCSQSCSAKVTNIGKHSPNKKIRYCQYEGCFEEVIVGRKYCCIDHRKRQKQYRIENGLQKSRQTDEEKKKSVNKIRVERKKYYVDYLGGKCLICGYNKYEGALHCHHVNPEFKDKALKLSGNCSSLERAKKELDKCVLLCSNCHSEVHAGIINLLDYVDLSKYI